MTPFWAEPDVVGACRVRLAAQGYLRMPAALGVPVTAPLRLLALRYSLELQEGVLTPDPLYRMKDINFSRFNWLGTLEPSVVLVGDAPSPRAPRDWYPFVGGPAAGYLWRALEGYPGLDGLALFNAVEGDSLAFIRSRIAQRVVALGSKASLALTERGIDHQVICHPSYARRWGQIRVESYRKPLFELMGVAEVSNG